MKTAGIIPVTVTTVLCKVISFLPFLVLGVHAKLNRISMQQYLTAVVVTQTLSLPAHTTRNGAALKRSVLSVQPLILRMKGGVILGKLVGVCCMFFDDTCTVQNLITCFHWQ